MAQTEAKSHSCGFFTSFLFTLMEEISCLHSVFSLIRCIHLSFLYKTENVLIHKMTLEKMCLCMKYMWVISDRVRLKAITYCLAEQLRMKRAFNQDHRQVIEKRTGGVLNKHTLWGPHTDWRRLIWECCNLSLCFYTSHLFIALTLFIFL